jgi:site-specific recombinase XerD
MALRMTLRTPMSPREAMAAAVANFGQRCRSRNLSPTTIRFYNFRLAAFARFLKEQELELAPADVTAQVIREFLEWERTRNSAALARHSHRTLSAFFNFLVNDGLLPSSPMAQVESIRQQTPVRPTVSLEQIEQLLGTCGQDFVGVRDRALILTLLDTGLRVAELSSLVVNGIDWAEQVLTVMGKGRRVPFGNTVKAALQVYLGRRGELEGVDALFVGVLSEPFAPRGVQQMLRTRGERAGITDMHITPHQFRRAFAVQFIRNGADPFTLQRILGHTDLTMTRRYCELAQTDIQDKHRKYSPGDSLQVQAPGGRKRLR